ncbi:Hypothetical protein, putative [Bodo saltans]|uniref:Uncharacterized protein n=1 Tax=Bodo saltans TaxID=75058 RepID=A0A0S4J394_BODSA|nr:Hypothetical protein, putative [Bodo saltans]|eukprot:CUG85506.1 Hypothetical protein, putative [Bodo saltans]
MALTQQQGHVLGKCLYIAAAAGVVGAFRQTAHSNEHHAAVSLVLAAGGVAAGLWLHTKLYLSDPTAREEYKRRILLQHFSKSVKDFGLAAILQLVDIDCCREQFLKEFSAGLRFGWVFAAYGAKSLTLLLNANIVRKDELLRALEGDLIVARRTADPFTSLWFIVGEASLYYLHANQCLPVAELRRLLDKEYHNPEARSGQVATAPDDVSCGASSDATDATTSGAIRHTFQK